MRRCLLRPTAFWASVSLPASAPPPRLACQSLPTPSPSFAFLALCGRLQAVGKRTSSAYRPLDTFSPPRKVTKVTSILFGQSKLETKLRRPVRRVLCRFVAADAFESRCSCEMTGCARLWFPCNCVGECDLATAWFMSVHFLQTSVCHSIASPCPLRSYACRRRS